MAGLVILRRVGAARPLLAGLAFGCLLMCLFHRGPPGPGHRVEHQQRVAVVAPPKRPSVRPSTPSSKPRVRSAAHMSNKFRKALAASSFEAPAAEFEGRALAPVAPGPLLVVGNGDISEQQRTLLTGAPASNVFRFNHMGNLRPEERGVGSVFVRWTNRYAPLDCCLAEPHAIDPKAGSGPKVRVGCASSRLREARQVILVGGGDAVSQRKYQKACALQLPNVSLLKLPNTLFNYEGFAAASNGYYGTSSGFAAILLLRSRFPGSPIHTFGMNFDVERRQRHHEMHNEGLLLRSHRMVTVHETPTSRYRSRNDTAGASVAVPQAQPQAQAQAQAEAQAQAQAQAEATAPAAVVPFPRPAAVDAGARLHPRPAASFEALGQAVGRLRSNWSLAPAPPHFDAAGSEKPAFFVVGGGKLSELQRARLRAALPGTVLRLDGTGVLDEGEQVGSLYARCRSFSCATAGRCSDGSLDCGRQRLEEVRGLVLVCDAEDFDSLAGVLAACPWLVAGPLLILPNSLVDRSGVFVASHSPSGFSLELVITSFLLTSFPDAHIDVMGLGCGSAQGLEWLLDDRRVHVHVPVSLSPPSLWETLKGLPSLTPGL